MSERTALIRGCGYVGLAMVKPLRELGMRVMGTTRSTARLAEIATAGAEPILVDVMRPETLPPAATADPVVVFDLIRPQKIGDELTDAGTRKIAAAFADGQLEALVYVSATSVYGRRSGEWTDETTPVNPSSPLGQARVDAENVYLDAWRDHGLPPRVCRVPGIYGPHRTLRQRLETGAYKRLEDEELWVSRIHVDDLVSGLIASWRRGKAGEIYLMCDDEPTTGDGYAELTASLLGLPMPPVADRAEIRQELSADAFERRVSSRRCLNTKMKQELGVELRYPNVRVGLPASLRAEGAI